MQTEPLKGSRKVAALIIMLGEDVSSQVLKFLREDEIAQIGKEMARLGSVPVETGENVLEEFHNMASVSNGGSEYTRKVLSKALGPDASKRVLERVTKSLERYAGFEALDKADPQKLSRFLQNENPQTIALVLANVDSRYGALLLSSLPEALGAEVAIRIANLREISPEIIKRISSCLHQKLGMARRETVDGAKTVAELVNKMDRSAGRNILEKIETENADLALNIRNLMLLFDYILLVESAGVRQILEKVDKKTLTLALKGTSEELQAHIFKNMSQRAVEMMKEDMEALGPVRVRDVEKAQREIVDVIQKLEDEGVIGSRGGGGGDGDQYVV